MNKFILPILYVMALVFGLLVISLILNYNVLNICLADKAPLLGAFGIIISAFIASFSVKETIKENNKKNYEDNLRLIVNNLKKDFDYAHVEGNLKPKSESYPEVNGINYDDILLYELQQINYYLVKLESIIENKKFEILLNSYANRLGYINNFIQTKMNKPDTKSYYEILDKERKKYLFKDKRKDIGLNSTNLMISARKIHVKN